MRTSIAVALLLAAVAAHGRTVLQSAQQPLDFDVHVAGHSSAQMDAARYSVQVGGEAAKQGRRAASNKLRAGEVG